MQAGGTERIKPHGIIKYTNADSNRKMKEAVNLSNRLQFETSPYLLQHKDNPVDWYPWCKEAFEKARSEDKPVFLSIGYS